jgi:hypothetical protein
MESHGPIIERDVFGQVLTRLLTLVAWRKPNHHQQKGNGVTPLLVHDHFSTFLYYLVRKYTRIYTILLQLPGSILLVVIYYL